MLPAAVGAKLMGRMQEVPCASEPTVEAVLVSSGQAVLPVLLRVKLAAMLGLLPLAGTGKFSGALPMFSSVTVFGLSLLIAPTAVAAKLSVGSGFTASSRTDLVPLFTR